MEMNRQLRHRTAIKNEKWQPLMNDIVRLDRFIFFFFCFEWQRIAMRCSNMIRWKQSSSSTPDQLIPLWTCHLWLIQNNLLLMRLLFDSSAAKREQEREQVHFRQKGKSPFPFYSSMKSFAYCFALHASFARTCSRVWNSPSIHRIDSECCK